MRKSLFSLAALLLLAGTSLAGSFRVHYSVRGEITVQAESSSEARRVVMEMFPKAVVTNALARGSLPFQPTSDTILGRVRMSICADITTAI
jgi:hypothetical protein